jgi:hypothetical protein
MIELTLNLHPLEQALLSTCFTWALAALGTSTVFMERI